MTNFEGQQRLFEGEVVSVELQAHVDGPYGWVVRVRGRRDAQTWGEGPESFYSELSPREALDVACATLGQLLGLEDD